MTDPRSESDAVAERLALTRAAIEAWTADTGYLGSAEAGSANSGFIDGQNLVRAGEILGEMESELEALDDIERTATPAYREEIDALRTQLHALRSKLQASSRRLHGLTR